MQRSLWEGRRSNPACKGGFGRGIFFYGEEGRLFPRARDVASRQAAAPRVLTAPTARRHSRRLCRDNVTTSSHTRLANTHDYGRSDGKIHNIQESVDRLVCGPQIAASLLAAEAIREYVSINECRFKNSHRPCEAERAVRKHATQGIYGQMGCHADYCGSKTALKKLRTMKSAILRAIDQQRPG